MEANDRIAKAKELLAEFAQICRELPDDAIPSLVTDRTIEGFLEAILDPTDVGKYPSVAEFFLRNKCRFALIASVRDTLTQSYSIQVSQGETEGYVSPLAFQWFPDGVLFLEGPRPYEGLLTHYANGQTSYAMSQRDMGPGSRVGKDDFAFVDDEELQRRLKLLEPPPGKGLEKPLRELESLLSRNCSDESQYQEIFSANPWVLGLQYRQIQRHRPLDDKNIPDFTGIRVTDGCRDIFEIKPPTMMVFRGDGEFTADFNTAWNQAERYLDFAREQRHYLYDKGMRFDNPRCYLVCGYNLPEDCMRMIRLKEKMNPAIQIMTYNFMMAYMKNTVEFIQRSRAQDATSES